MLRSIRSGDNVSPPAVRSANARIAQMEQDGTTAMMRWLA